MNEQQHAWGKSTEIPMVTCTVKRDDAAVAKAIYGRDVSFPCRQQIQAQPSLVKEEAAQPSVEGYQLLGMECITRVMGIAYRLVQLYQRVKG